MNASDTGMGETNIEIMKQFDIGIFHEYMEEVNMGLQATNAGIDFQQRVSAYMMILMEFDMDISLVCRQVDF